MLKKDIKSFSILNAYMSNSWPEKNDDTGVYVKIDRSGSNEL